MYTHRTRYITRTHTRSLYARILRVTLRGMVA